MTFAQLYLTGKEAQENPDSYLVAEVQGNELRVTDVSEGGDDYDQYRALLPPVFTRKGIPCIIESTSGHNGLGGVLP